MANSRIVQSRWRNDAPKGLSPFEHKGWTCGYADGFLGYRFGDAYADTRPDSYADGYAKGKADGGAEKADKEAARYVMGAEERAHIVAANIKALRS